MRLEAKVYGLVQGVFFRQTTMHQARQLHLTGWVRNEPDGSVQVVAEGDEQALRQFSTYLRQGPPGARVERVAETWQDAAHEFSQFSVRF